MQRIIAPTENSLVSIIVPLSLTEDYCYIGNLERFALTGEKPANLVIRYYREPTDLMELHDRIATEIEKRKDNFRQISYSTKLTKKEILLYIPLILAGLVPDTIPFVGDEIEKIIKKLGDIGGALGGTATALVDPLAAMKGFSFGNRLFSSIPFLSGAYCLVRTRVKKYNIAKNAETENEFREKVCKILDRIADDVRYQLVETVSYPLNEFLADRLETILRGHFLQPSAFADNQSYLAFKKIANDPLLLNKAPYNMQRYFRRKVEMYESR
ncbi:hypothetical protein JXA85_02040 [Candidatus Woesearchaeota archaeon]|nr:hypothetical protein [Candidatus Woesearchaeota archaeon]